PSPRVILEPTTERPRRVQRPDFQHLADEHGLALAGAFTNAKCFVDGGQLHMRLLAAIIEEVDPADHPHDGTGPYVRRAPGEWRWPLAGQYTRQLSAKHLVLPSEMRLAKSVRQADDGIVGWLGRGGDRGFLDG